MNVLVDDNDPSVQYSNPSKPGWKQVGGASEFNTTTHEPLSPDESATLSFTGTSITVFGTVANNGEAGMNFSIDGRQLGSFEVEEQSAQGHNKPFWNCSALEDVPHTLTITLDHDSKLHSNRTLFLDYFVYTTTTSTAGKSVLIDDSETGVITYSPDWKAYTDSDASLNRTQHVSDSDSRGSWVSLCFEGTRISFFGPSSMPSVTINGSQAVLTSQQIPKNQNPLFKSSVLPQGSHTMNITVGSSTAIDYFLVTTDLDTTTAPLCSGMPPSETAQNSSETAQTPETAQTSSSSSASISHVSKTLPISAIVGGAVGGLALLLLLLVAALMWRRRARRIDQPAFEYPGTSGSYYPWANKRESVTSLTTLTEDDDRERPKNFEKERPPSRYIYYE